MSSGSGHLADVHFNTLSRKSKVIIDTTGKLTLKNANIKSLTVKNETITGNLFVGGCITGDWCSPTPTTTPPSSLVDGDSYTVLSDDQSIVLTNPSSIGIDDNNYDQVENTAMSNDGNIVAYGINGNNGFTIYSIRVFEKTSSTTPYIQKGNDIVGPSDTAYRGIKGLSLSADGLTVAFVNDSPASIVVYIWDSMTNDWIQKGSDITGLGTISTSDRISSFLSADGDTVLITNKAASGGGSSRGIIQVYDWDGIAWIQKGSDIQGLNDSEQFGNQVSLSVTGTGLSKVYTVAGATTRYVTPDTMISITDHTTLGVVRIYRWSGSAWVQLGNQIVNQAEFTASFSSFTMTVTGPVIGEIEIGQTIASTTSNNIYTIIKNQISGTPGGAGTYTISDDLTFPSEPCIGIYDNSTSSYARRISLSGDGTTIAISARFFPSYNVNVQYGLVHIFKWSGSAWLLKGSTIFGSDRQGQFGSRISLSYDGNIISSSAILAPGKNTVYGVENGVVYVYDWESGISEWVLRRINLSGRISYSKYGDIMEMSSNGEKISIATAGGINRNIKDVILLSPFTITLPDPATSTDRQINIISNKRLLYNVDKNIVHPTTYPPEVTYCISTNDHTYVILQSNGVNWVVNLAI
jgi:hypothetical protein